MSKTNSETELSGLLGEVVSVRKVGGRVVIKNRPKRKVGKPSEKLEIAQEKFQDATQYARQQMELPESKTLYATGITDKKRSAFVVALSDYLVAPKVRSIETPDYHGAIGDPISVHAKDDFMVTRVRVVITNASGTVIEEGDAGPDTSKVGSWAYKATVANPTLAGTIIKAVAYDRPGNSGSAQVVL